MRHRPPSTFPIARGPRRRGFGCVVFAIGVASASWSAQGAGVRPNLLLITLDTTRADRLGCYGFREGSTPRIDRLAAEGALAAEAVAVAPLTLPAHASILTGLYPPRHGVRDNGDFVLPAAETTLGEHLKRQGYATVAAVGSVVLAAAQGLDQGFDLYDEPRPAPAKGAGPSRVVYRQLGERNAASVTDAALSAVGRARPGPYFLWAHYFDPHRDYEPPEPFRKRFADRLYDGEIAYVDAEVGRLLDGLGKRGRLDGTLVVVVGDHGESLWEHGEATHGLFIYDATIRIPCVLWWPGKVARGARITDLVSQVDLLPTMLDLMGLPPLRGAQGRSFASAARGVGRSPGPPVYSESLYGERAYGWAPLASLREPARKFIEAPEPEIYDLARDPGEKENLAPARTEELRDWRRRFSAALEAIGVSGEDSKSGLSRESREALQSLGYVSSGAPGAGRLDRPDPKRLVAEHDLFLQARALIATGKSPEALTLLRRLLARDPGNPAALAAAGTLLFSMGRRDEGIADLRAAVSAAPGVYEHRRNLANALHEAGRFDDAVTQYRAALDIQPFSGEIHFGLAKVLFAKNDLAGAVRECREAIRLKLDGPAVHDGLGIILEASGDLDGAERSYRKAVEVDPSYGESWNHLGIVLEKRDRLEEARGAYTRAVDANPADDGALFNRAKVSLRLKNYASATRDAESLLARTPAHGAVRFLLARIRFESGDRSGAARMLDEFLRQPDADPRLVPKARELRARLSP